MTKMKIAIVAAGALVLAGCGNKAAVNIDGQPEAKPQNTPITAVDKGADKSDGVISSIKEAMGLGKVMKCTYKTKDASGGAGMEVVSYINGKKYKSDVVVAGKAQHMIFDESAMYSWGDGLKQGMKITTSCAEEMAKNIPAGKDAANVPDPTGEKAFDSAMDVKCVESGSIDFSIPTDVTFVDQCEMLKNVMKNIPGGALPKGMPQGIPGNLPGGAGTQQ
jgi:hypothetical protein